MRLATHIPIDQSRRSVLRLCFLMCILVVLSVSAVADPVEHAYEITYVAYDQVYISGGRDDGIALGDRATIHREGTIAVELEVAHISAHSAALRILSPQSEIQTGDSVYVAQTLAVASSPSDTAVAAPTPKRAIPRENLMQTTHRQDGPRVRGHIGLRSSHWVDEDDADLDYSQSSVNLNLDARHVGHPNLSLAVRTSGRHYDRAQSSGASASASDWTNSIYELALIYDSDRYPLSARVGRLVPRRIGAIGRLDGVLGEYHPHPTVGLGLFGGAEPRWQYTSSSDDLTKLGAYVSVERGDRRGTLIEATLAAVSEYHDGTVSREVLYWQSRLRGGARLYLTNSLEIDINRGWRRESAGQSVALTGARVGARYRFLPWLTGGLNYDNRKNHRTYTTRSVADSLFNDNLSQGLRSRWDIDLSRVLSVSTNAGYRMRDGDASPTYSYGANIRARRFPTTHTTLSFNADGFEGPTEHGYRSSIRASQPVRRGAVLGLAYHLYEYRVMDADDIRVNRRFELSLRAGLWQGVNFDSQFEYGFGDDTVGRRTSWGLGYSF